MPILAQAQDQQIQVTVMASVEEQDGSLVRLRGSVVIETKAFVLHADNAIYNMDTGEIEASGNVRITPKETGAPEGTRLGPQPRQPNDK